MKVGNAILAIFLWLLIPVAFFLGVIGSIPFMIGGGNSTEIFFCMIIIPIVLFILGLVVLILGIEKDIPPKVIEEKSFLRFCPNCGRNIPFDANICPYCGKNFQGGKK